MKVLSASGNDGGAPAPEGAESGNGMPNLENGLPPMPLGGESTYDYEPEYPDQKSVRWLLVSSIMPLL